jgi:hypothetical protein
MGLAYRLLPTSEPRRRESGAITQAKFAAPGQMQRHAPLLPGCRTRRVHRIRSLARISNIGVGRTAR